MNAVKEVSKATLSVYEVQLQVLRLSTPRMVALIEMAIQQGTSVLIENLETSVDPVLAPVVGRQTIRRGRSQYLKLGDKEVSYNANFRLILQTRLSNPHYPPELQAECTLINFTVTEKGLEDQLLDLTMQKEQPRLFQRRIHLVQQQNEFTILLAELENTLLRDISSAEGDVLENIELIQNLEKTKRVTTEVSEKVALAKITEEKLNAISEMYRPVARRGARLFFLLAQLFKIHSFYLFSMESFVAVINRAIDSISEKPQTGGEDEDESDAKDGAVLAEAGPDDSKLSANHPAAEQTCDRADPAATDDSTEENHEKTTTRETEGQDAPSDGQSSSSDAGKAHGEETEGPKGEVQPADQLLESPDRSAADEYGKTEEAEEEDEKDEEQNSVTEEEVRLLSQVRPDPTAPPMPEAARGWLSSSQWACCRSLEQLKSFKNNQISLLQNFDQDSLGWARWMAEDTPENADLPRLFKGISEFEKLLLLRYLRPDRMISALQQFVSGQLGHFFVEPPTTDLQEIEKEADKFTPLFIVLFPGVDPTPVLEITARSKGCTADNGKFVNISMGQGQEERALAAVQEAAQSGGWVVLQNVHLMQEWLKASKYATIPFEDIRYILGEIMYGGHITDGFDRRLNNTYLANLILPEVLQSFQLGPSFRTPDPAKTEFAAYQKFVEEKTPPENPQEVSGVAGSGSSTGRKEDTVLTMVDSLLGTVPIPFDVAAIRSKVREFHPATVVCLQGALNVTDAMEQLEASLNMSRVPEAWKPYAYESRKQLGPWVNDLLHRVKQLEEWSTDFTLPCPLWISGLFNPMSFLTAVMQVRARAESLALDRMCLRWTVTNIRYGAAVAGAQGGASQQQPLSSPETGVLIHGLFLEGAAWEEGKGDVEGNLTQAQPKVLQYPMPVFLVEAIPTAEIDNTAMYSCPVYLTSARGPTYVTTANLRMSGDDSERRWILAGVALTMATDA
ncbi:hypothetical protein EAH_00000540 [Eimeria acervulina]|uniref:Dynein heavy chain family protein n=1 Tax=Eimeria acervulina TaxID=5801 RepID=U6GDS3_EIMAC|nr:hypothetical protein EAH_00000540 [Eimeria acervulina]CDI77483.1 hypothetical protein EAH_00000540 [Eimeria acervulina]